jgi:NAD(P)-dependent dehydrogenase (short-subunit alcohol dehydrogenase family)
MASLVGRVYAITGAASGIGLATARELAARGASIFLADINEVGLKKILPTVQPTAGGAVDTFVLDVRNRDEVHNFVQGALKRFGRLDGGANIAGIVGKDILIKPIWEAGVADYELVQAINTKGTFNCLAELLQPGVLDKGGSIVNMASIAGQRGVYSAAAYCTSKAGVLALTKVAAIDAGSRGIRVNAVAP